ncbi:unnamed protein product [Cunninghamella blakesleeana]
MTTKEIIPEEALTNIVQQHLVTGDEYEDQATTSTFTNHQDNTVPETNTTSETSIEEGGSTGISIPFHLKGVAVTHDIYSHVNHLIQRQQLQRSKWTNDIRIKGGKMVHQEDHDPTEESFENLDKPGGFRQFHILQQKRLRKQNNDTLLQQQQQEEEEQQKTLSPLSSSSKSSSLNKKKNKQMDSTTSAYHELFRPSSIGSQESYTINDYTELYRQPSLAQSISMSFRNQEDPYNTFLSSQHHPNHPNHKDRLTRHFLEYLVIDSIMHFAGESLTDSENEDDDDDIRRDEENPYISEQTPLLSSSNNNIKKKAMNGSNGDGNDQDPFKKKPIKNERRKLKRQMSSMKPNDHKTNTTKTVFLLFKAFIGSGILFLPKAFSNGGLFFSVALIWLMGGISLYCFLLLLDCKNYISGSYGDIGEATYGIWMRRIVLFSIAISQLGFVCGGTIFIIQNVIEAVKGLTHGQVILQSNSLLLWICILLMPFVLIRKIAKLSPTALISDVLIITGLVVLLSYDFLQLFIYNPKEFSTLPPTPGPNLIWGFNPIHYPVFIGTAVYSFEGIGLIIPIRDAMERPQDFPRVLTFVMVMVAFTLCLVGSLGYLSFGSNVETVALLNLPPGVLPNTIQLGYAIAVQLSNVLAIFPTIRIVEQALFGNRTGKYSLRIKWEKNIIRFVVVIAVGVVAFFGANDLDKFISLIGSICCCPLSLIFPPLFHLKLSSTTGYKRWIDMVLVIFGISVMMFTLYNTSKQWGSSE